MGRSSRIAGEPPSLQNYFKKALALWTHLLLNCLCG